MIELRVIAETVSTITFGWDSVAGATGFRFTSEKQAKPSHTWDGTRTSVKFQKGSAWYKVEALNVGEVGEYPAEEPPPPPTGILEWRPPGYNGGDPRLPSSYPGFEYREIGGTNMTVNMTNGVDYFVKITSPIAYTTKQSDPDAFAGVRLNGGRHVVIVGGDVRIDSGALSGRQAEPLGFLIDGGTDGGIVHLEGLYIRANNPVTIRTRRAVQIEWCVLEAAYYRPTSDPAHSDLVQVWGTTTGHTPCEGIKMHFVSCFTDYTGLSNLVERTPTNRTTDYAEPKTWWRHKIDIHPRMVGTLGEAGNYCYHSGSPTGGNGPGWQNFGPYTVYDGEIYAELPQGGGGAYVRPIDGVCCLRSLDGGLWIFPYEIKNPMGQTLYTSPAEPTGGNAPYSVSGPGAPGNYLTFDRVGPLSKQKWIIGQPPLAEGAVAEGTGVQGQARRVFVPRNSVGMSYEPKGYA